MVGRGRTTHHGSERRSLIDSGTPPSPSLEDDYEEVLAYPAPDQPHSQDHYQDHYQASTLGPSDVWREFEAARSSAEYHLDEYLRYLAQSCPAIDDRESSQGNSCRRFGTTEFFFFPFSSNTILLPFLTQHLVSLSRNTSSAKQSHHPSEDCSR